MLETISGVVLFWCLCAGNSELNHFKKMTDDVDEQNLEVTRIDALFEPMIKVLVGGLKSLNCTLLWRIFGIPQ